MNLFNRIIAILLIISLQACGVGTQSLLGNLGNQPNTSGPAVGPALSQTIEQAEQAEQEQTEAAAEAPVEAEQAAESAAEESDNSAEKE